MKKTLKKLSRKGLASFLALVLCMGTMSLPAMAAELDGQDQDDERDDFNVELVVKDDSTDEEPEEDADLPETKDTKETDDVSDTAEPSEEADEENSEKPAEGSNEFPVNGTEEEKQEWFQNEENVSRPGQSQGVVTNPGTPEKNPDAGKVEETTDPENPETPADPENPETPADPENPETPVDPENPETPVDPENPETPVDPENPETPVVPETPSKPALPGLNTDKNWDVFYDEGSNTYKLTYTIAENADGDQTLDLTYAMELLGAYAKAAEKPAEPVKDFSEPGLSEEDQAKMDAYEEELNTWVNEDYPQICEIIEMFNYPGYIKDKGLTEADVVAEFNSIGIGHAEPPVKPDIQEVDTSSPEYQEYLEKLAAYEEAYAKYEKDLANYNRQLDAINMEPGDIRKFEIYLNSQSGHTYKYKNGSFTLATPKWTNQESGVIGFDGQELPGPYMDDMTYHVTVRCEPIQAMLEAVGLDSYDRFNGTWPGYMNGDFKEFLSKYEGETLADQMNSYLLDFYNQKDGTEYKTVEELISGNAHARAELCKTDTDGNKYFKISGTQFDVTAHANSDNYDLFYKELFGFVFGDQAKIDAITGKPIQWDENGSVIGYEHPKWTDQQKELALYYYMSKQGIWKETDGFFQDLLAEGLTKGDIANFMMAFNIAGFGTGNDWQNTAWSYEGSLELEQMDIDFTLDKTAPDGTPITEDETEFKVWYIDKVKDENGDEQEVQMYCKMEEDGTYVWVRDSSAAVSTKNGKLEINYTLMKDIVYYLQESKAPEGYEADTTVYVITDQKTYDELAASTDTVLDKDGNLVANFQYIGGVKENGTAGTYEDDNGAVSWTVKFVNAEAEGEPEDPPTPPPTPEDPDDPPPPPPPGDEDGGDDPDDPTPPPTPDTPAPPVEVEDEPTPLIDVPEEEVPLSNLPVEETEELTEIPEEEVPLADIPQTGDISVLWYVMALTSLLGLAALTFLSRRRGQLS